MASGDIFSPPGCLRFEEFEILWKKCIINCAGNSLFVLRALINHSCIAPNVLLHPTDDYKYIALVDIPKGEQLFQY